MWRLSPSVSKGVRLRRGTYPETLSGSMGHAGDLDVQNDCRHHHPDPGK